ncbi:T7SS effector LXG polymorphic toxin [Sutcliffiella horikoshii]|uniref:T7SS effector LXG polymorphic toxin n=1 Tax=Sutcliffiella horikoshii TaxID=79883 RepID=UPI003D813161
MKVDRECCLTLCSDDCKKSSLNCLAVNNHTLWFYEFAHLPVLQFFQSFLPNFQLKLKQLQFEMDGLEGNSHGFIDECFLTRQI